MKPDSSSQPATPPRHGAERELRLLSYVGRWQIVQVNRRQHLSDHLYQVSLLAWRMVEDCDLRSRIGANMEDVFREALLHDVPETLSGDIPSPAHQKIKRADGWKAWLEARVVEFFPWYTERPESATKYIVTICDLLEALLFLTEETQMGNQYVIPHLTYLRERMDELLDNLQPPVRPGGAPVGSQDDIAYDYERIRVETKEVVKRWVLATLDRATQPAKVFLNP